MLVFAPSNVCKESISTNQPSDILDSTRPLRPDKRGGIVSKIDVTNFKHEQTLPTLFSCDVRFTHVRQGRCSEDALTKKQPKTYSRQV